MGEKKMPTKPERVTQRLISKAIKGSFGQITVIAKRCGCTTQTIYTKMKKYPKLAEKIEKEKTMLRETQIELAKRAVLEALTPKEQEDARDRERRSRVAMWLLERTMPEEYNPTVKLDAAHDVAVTVVRSKDLEEDPNTYGG